MFIDASRLAQVTLHALKARALAITKARIATRTQGAEQGFPPVAAVG
jgi:hypothetical protein